MGKVAEPVLTNLAAGTLKRNMPVECVTGNVAERRKVTHLEAIGRLLGGIAPWLEAPLGSIRALSLAGWHSALSRVTASGSLEPAMVFGSFNPRPVSA